MRAAAVYDAYADWYEQFVQDSWTFKDRVRGLLAALLSPRFPGTRTRLGAHRELKKRYVEQGKAHAALVVDGDEAIAWCEYGTPEELATFHHRKQYEAECDVLPDYRLTCIFVDRRYRRRGLAEVALRGALDQIARAGGGVAEGYPHEISDEKMSSSFLYKRHSWLV